MFNRVFRTLRDTAIAQNTALGDEISHDVIMPLQDFHTLKLDLYISTPVTIASDGVGEVSPPVVSSTNG